MASITKRGRKWWVRWREAGRHRSVTVRSERQALRLKIEIEDALERTGRYQPRRAGGSTPLRVLMEDYVRFSVRSHRPNTTKRYAQMLELFRRWIGSEARAEALCYQLLSDYHAHLQDPVTGRHLHRRSAETIRKHIEAIELLWKWGWQRQARGDYTGIPQPDSLELQRQPPPHKLAPTWADMDACIAAAGGWQRHLYFVLRCTGLRVGQAMGLTWEDVDLHAARLHVRPELGKSKTERRGRWMPIAPVLVEELSGWGQREGFVVPCSREHREARARDAARAWKRAGVDPRRWQGSAHHAFRAGFQSGLKQLGADDEAVEFLVGHSRGIREHYVSPDALPLVAAVNLVPPVGVRTARVQGIPLAARRQGQGQGSDGWRRAMGIEPTERHLSMRPDRF